MIHPYNTQWIYMEAIITDSGHDGYPVTETARHHGYYNRCPK